MLLSLKHALQLLLLLKHNCEHLVHIVESCLACRKDIKSHGPLFGMFGIQVKCTFTLSPDLQNREHEKIKPMAVNRTTSRFVLVALALLLTNQSGFSVHVQCFLGDHVRPKIVQSQSSLICGATASRGAAEARGAKLRFALAQEGCSKACRS